MEEFENIQFDAEMSERVDRFLLKEMSKEEAAAFIKDIKVNPELKACYQRQFELMRGVKFQHMSELMKAKERELSYSAQNSKTDFKVFFYRYRLALSSCAVAAALVCGVFVWDGSVTRSVGDQMYPPIASHLDIRGEDPIDNIDNLVESGNYKEAIEEIDKQLEVPYELGDDPDAIASYNQSMNDLKYRKALILLKMGKKHQAKAILKQIDDERSHEVLDKLLW